MESSKNKLCAHLTCLSPKAKQNAINLCSTPQFCCMSKLRRRNEQKEDDDNGKHWLELNENKNAILRVCSKDYLPSDLE